MLSSSESLQTLPLPILDLREIAGLRCFTDDGLAQQTGVRIAFTGKQGGVSQGNFEGLNLGSHVGDDARTVEANRHLLLSAFDAADMELLVPNQVHGDAIVAVEGMGERETFAMDLASIRMRIAEGVDGIIVEAADVAALLCFADCVPVAVVSPSGLFAIVHAGWRGVMARIAPQAVAKMTRIDGCDPCAYNVYIGPHIHGECFETSANLCAEFGHEFGECVVLDERHVSLARALRMSVQEVGISAERIADADACTVCRSDEFFSYRASGGNCGRHGALGFRRTRRG